MYMYLNAMPITQLPKVCTSAFYLHLKVNLHLSRKGPKVVTMRKKAM